MRAYLPYMRAEHTEKRQKIPPGRASNKSAKYSSIPGSPLSLTFIAFGRIIPKVHSYLRRWREIASDIPDPELRKQAVASIDAKTFHCEGGGLYSILAGQYSDEVLRFIVAYQTISDYLDNLCDRSGSLNVIEFATLHEAMEDALTPGKVVSDYYRDRGKCSDGGYLNSLVSQCRSVLVLLPSYQLIRESVIELEQHYSRLQVYKHAKPDERVNRLTQWFHSFQPSYSDMTWFEFAASAGSTLGIFCLVAAAADASLSGKDVDAIKKAYFPWVQGLHILLDYFIDREEDRLCGDLNFCFYYPDERLMIDRLITFLRQSRRSVYHLPHKKFHTLICNGLPSIYCADTKLDKHKEMRFAARKILLAGGSSTVLFFVFLWVYRRISLLSFP